MQALIALVSLLFAFIIVAVSLFMPPEGEVDSSVIYIFAQLLIFCASIFGLDAVLKDGFKIMPRLPTVKRR